MDNFYHKNRHKILDLHTINIFKKMTYLFMEICFQLQGQKLSNTTNEVIVSPPQLYLIPQFSRLSLLLFQKVLIITFIRLFFKRTKSYKPNELVITEILYIHRFY